ncbi:MAG: hypothetical protein Q7S56_01005 [Nanoarchaeota archaeon]|nr:hypothetical protein [Nanoarchaeota archaeon]
MSKVIGYILCLAGLLVIASGVGPINSQLTFLKDVPSNYLMIGGLAALILGIVLISAGNQRTSAEVPIYHGKNVVGYRRH